jgi:hypothetical protein
LKGRTEGLGRSGPGAIVIAKEEVAERYLSCNLSDWLVKVSPNGRKHWDVWVVREDRDQFRLASLLPERSFESLP